MDYFIEYGYAGLFLIAFLAATILPLSSEIVLSALTIKGLSPITLVVIATAGNVLGSLLNYALGYSASSAVIKKWLRMSDNSLAQAEQRFTKYGLLTLCFAWVPIIGDPITVLSANVFDMWLLSTSH